MFRSVTFDTFKSDFKTYFLDLLCLLNLKILNEISAFLLWNRFFFSYTRVF